MRSVLLLLVVLAAGPLAAQPTYRVYPAPVESPIHTAPPPPADARVLLADPSDATASPFGWHDVDGVPGADATTTQGNNVLAYLDRAADNTPDPADFPDGGAALTFDFPLDLTQPPSAYGDAVVADLFYWANHVHDVLYGFGFDEAAGNFQQNTYGRGGLGGDALRLEAQDGSGTNGANFSTPPDGSPPRLQTFLWTLSSPVRDGALDHGVVVHEMTHGVSNRLTGGPSTVSCLGNAEQAGEGWSDLYALLFTMEATDARTDARGLGTYILAQPPDGPGIRPSPYSTDLAVNDATYGDTRTSAVPHGVGFVWASIVWEVVWDLIDASGFDPDLGNAGGAAGNLVALDLLTTGLKLQPCFPGFVDARDAILAADVLLYNGVHTDRLWAAFARRGLGLSATQGAPNSNADNVEAFDVPQTTPGSPTPPSTVLALSPAAPNPTRGTVRVDATLDASGPARLTVVDALGREVAVVADGDLAAGAHRWTLDAGRLAPGAYRLRLEAPGGVRTRPLTVVR